MAITVRRDVDLVPLCPHCNRQLDEIRAVEPSVDGRGAFGFGKRTVYACPSCRKALGVSHRKGVWSG